MEKVFFQLNDWQIELFTQSFAAFFGAFFAYLFLRIGDFFSKVYERQVKHFNSLVILETQLNELGGIVHDNLYVIPDFRRVITSGNVYFNNLHSLPYDKSHYEKLYDLDLINELFSYNYQLRKLNDDIETLTNGYGELKNALIQGSLNHESYILNVQNIAHHLITLEVFLKDIEEKNVRLQARITVQMRRDIPLGTRLLQIFAHSDGSKLNKKEIEKQEAKLRSELKESSEKSQKEIDEAVKKHGLKRI